MSEARRTRLRELVDCSRQMQDQAVAGDWDSVVRLQNEHRRLCELFFRQPVDAGLATDCAAAIREMLEHNRRISELGARERASCLGRKRDIDKRRNAVRAYREHTA